MDQNQPSLASRALERLIPMRTVQTPPSPINSAQVFFAEHDRMSRDLIVTKDALTDAENKLVQAYQANEALQARYDADVAEYKKRDTEARAEVNALGRTMVELATQVKAIGDVLGSAINLTIKAQEVVQRFHGKFREELENEQRDDPPPRNDLEPYHAYNDRRNGRLPPNNL